LFFFLQQEAGTGLSCRSGGLGVWIRDRDLGFPRRLKGALVGGTGLEKVMLATGCPVTELVLPEALAELVLEYLPKLTEEGLTMEGINNITGYRHAETPGVDGMALLERLHAAKLAGEGKLERFRLHVDVEDDGTLLEKYKDYRTYTTSGQNDNVHSGLTGRVRMTRYLADDRLEAYREKYPELEIVQPEYTMIEYDDSVADDANVSNLDNETGYKYGNQYVPSGHILAILKRRHRVLAKVTKMPTTRTVNIANTDVTVNNPDGEMTYCELDDNDSNKYHDGSPAKLDGTEGDWMMLEPFFWSKGINDYLNNKKYACYNSNGRDNKPSTPEATVLTLDDIKATEDGYTSGRKITTGKGTLAECYSTDSAYSVCKVDVSGYRRVRYPSVLGTSQVGSIFVDESGEVLKSVWVATLGAKFENGMYLISDVPEGARELYFSIYNTAEFDKVVLSNSDKIEDMEPEWVGDEYLCGVTGSSAVGTKLRSCITQTSTSANIPWTDFHYYSQQRGMQQIDFLMHSRIANLSYAKYGRRDMQAQCGAGQHTSSRRTGGTASRGMRDTVGYDEAYAIDQSIAKDLIDNVTHPHGWYIDTDAYGRKTVVQVNNTCCVSYEDIFGHKYDMMDMVDQPNSSGNMGKFRIFMPDGTIRWVKGNTIYGWITAVAHGLYMDMVPVGILTGSNTTYYTDFYEYGGSAGRVVCRGYSYAYAGGGVAYAFTVYGPTSAYSSVGSRLAFRGKIVKAQSVAAYKALEEVA